jgi:hypothetical protein
MTRRRFEHLLGSIGVLRDPCDLDLLLFFHRHPRSILTSDRLAAYVGYDLNQLARSLDLLTDAGLLARSQHHTHAARLYVLKTPQTGWLTSVIEIASTREGRQTLIQTMQEAAKHDASDHSAGQDAESAFVRGRARKAAAR